jgi:hypothetical protein
MCTYTLPNSLIVGEDLSSCLEIEDWMIRIEVFRKGRRNQLDGFPLDQRHLVIRVRVEGKRGGRLDWDLQVA